MVNWDQIDRLAKAQRLVDPGASEEDLLRQLKVWWCITYKRPFKDPLLDIYTIDELIYEFLCHHYLNPEHDPVERKSKDIAKKEDDDWIIEQLKQTQQAPKPPTPEIPDLPDLSAKFDQ